MKKKTTSRRNPRHERSRLAPSMFLCWVPASGVVQLLSRLSSGTGAFEDTATGLAFGIGVATWASLVHDLTDGVLGVIDMRAYEAALNGPTFWWSCSPRHSGGLTAWAG